MSDAIDLRFKGIGPLRDALHRVHRRQAALAWVKRRGAWVVAAAMVAVAAGFAWNWFVSAGGPNFEVVRWPTKEGEHRCVVVVSKDGRRYLKTDCTEIPSKPPP